MGDRVELPSGGWVEIRDPVTVKTRDRKALLRAGEDKGNDLERGFALQEAVVRLGVMAWSFPFPIPSEDGESIDELMPADFDAIVEAAAPLNAALFPDFNAVPDEDPKDPPPSSNGSSISLTTNGRSSQSPSTLPSLPSGMTISGSSHRGVSAPI